MYKKCALFLVLMVSSAVYATTGAALNDAITGPESPLQRAFSSDTSPCAEHLSLDDLTRPGLLHSFYSELNYQPQWQSTALREQLQDQLAELVDDGLNPIDYALPTYPAHADADSTLCAELAFSRTYLRALSDLARGKVAQEKVDRFWREPDSAAPNLRPNVLTLAWQGLDNLPHSFAQARPKHPQYARLRNAYQQLRSIPIEEWPSIARGPLLKPGMHDPRSAQIRSRLQAQGYLATTHEPANRSLYDPELADAVKLFQSQHNLQSDAVVGPDTLNALNTQPSHRLQQLRANLERWRWLEADIEPTSVLVDIVGGYLTYYQDGEAIWQTRAQVGRPNRQTPRLKSLINRLSLNPTWTVPPTILRQDKLPAIRRDLDYLARNDMRVLDSQGRTINPDSVDWQQPGNIMLRQAAGPNNPLGKLVIRFPNPFSVYLHDTPSQHLFAKSPRTFSSGCVRIEGIQQILPLILPQQQSQEVTQKIASRRTSEVNYSQRLPVVLAYWTAEVNDQGQLILRNDPYNLDAALLRELDAVPQTSRAPSAGTRLTLN